MTGLRERKKQATRVALREAALRLAIEHGPANVRVDDIAEAAGVSPRTYNNYFSSREEAIVAAVTADRENRIAVAVAERSPDTRLAEAIIDAITEQYTDPDEQSRDALLLITTNPGLRTAFLDAPAALEDPLQEVIATRVGDQQTARVLAASVAAAVRVALERWTQPAGNGLVVVSGSLPDLLRRTLEPLTPALDAAEA
ncbi:TetR/AcrR family transcriptional regulator [Amycolatopsis echigonensis]|uniref:TetR/AcrR family transcriptional regulator n=1 Tax=Amycolatopsis echigonensis TaxID=2576905 RepID=A0A8E1VZP0_9PSEU|nr:TetR/AcrR family transcriptional regulator [Amycolatopsis echigonensis]MBB2501428.1 TetR/AcrR family transcriptional regulator [Amycolatopsis echigonensis]